MAETKNLYSFILSRAKSCTIKILLTPDSIIRSPISTHTYLAKLEKFLEKELWFHLSQKTSHLILKKVSEEMGQQYENRIDKIGRKGDIGASDYVYIGR